MVIQALYDNNKVFLNTNYIIDVWEIDKPKATAFVKGETGINKYEIEQSELQKWISWENTAKILRC